MRIVFGYCVPETVTVVEFESIRPSSVQITPAASQSVVAGSVMLTAPLPKPKSTEGRCVGGLLKEQKGAPLNLG